MYPTEYRWTSSPIVVTTMSRQAVSWSAKNPTSTLNAPAEIQRQSVTPAPCSPKPPLRAW